MVPTVGLFRSLNASDFHILQHLNTISGPLLVTFGVFGLGSRAVDVESLLQEWRPATKTWIASPAVMTRRWAFSSVTVDARHVCPQGEVLASYKVSQSFPSL